MLEITVPYLLERCASKSPDKVGIVAGGSRSTFKQWDDNASTIADWLLSLGLRAGERVATLFANTKEALEVFFGLWKIGAVIVPLNTRLTVWELQGLLEHSDPRAVLYGVNFRDQVEDLKRVLPHLDYWAAPGSGVVGNAAVDRSNFIVKERDLACILYTAGTTGSPKGVMLTHKNLVWGAVNLAQDSYFRPHLKVLLAFPLFHAAGFGLLTASLYMGSTLVALEKFYPEAIMELTETERLGKIALAPAAWSMILSLPGLDRYDTSSVESVTSGGSAMPVDLKRRLKEVFPRARLGETYGMTETSATISTWKCEEDPETEGCVGRPFTNVEVRVVDDDRTTLGPYQVGEIVTKGPNVTSGYWRAEEETKAALRDGWLYTGDLGYLDEEGRIYLVGRKKELINTGGEKVVPGEVERVLSMHPSVADVAVIGVDDPLWGERVHAIVVKKQEVTERELIEFCEGRLAGYKKPKSIEFVDVIPRSPAGKIMRHLLKKQRTVSHRG